MNTNTKELGYKAVQKMIKQAVVLKHRETWGLDESKNSKPFEVMTNALGEQLYYLLVDDKPDTYQDWGSALWNMKHFMQSLLSLLAKPGVLAQLIKSEQADAAQNLNKLIDFFQSIDVEETHAFLDFQIMDFGSTDKQLLSGMMNRYDFSKREQVHNTFFYDYAIYKRREQQALAYYNKNIANK